MKPMIILATLILTASMAFAAGCPVGGTAPATYGTNNVWTGYVFDGINFDTYIGHVTEGATASPDFDESFGGSNTNYSTLEGCTTQTETFSVRYKLKQTFVSGSYTITVGADDGYRLSVDGGATWLINNWNLQSYTTTTQSVNLSGTVNLVLEYYENSGDNRVSFDIVKDCSTTGNPNVYGTNNQWIGYIYGGTNFNTYKGYVTEGSVVSPNFDEGFGGDVVTYTTSDCSITTTQFSVRYRLKTTLTAGNYKFVVGGDDGYRLSLDGGANWVINQWNDQSYGTTTYSATLASGNYNMVLEYYENAGQNRVSFNLSGGTVLPVTMTGFEGILDVNHQVDLSWATMMERDIDHYEVERSGDGQHFEKIGSLPSQTTITTHDYQLNYSFTDADPLPGTSYYRIFVVGKDNYTNQSPVVQIVNNQARGIKIYPTIVQNNLVYVESDKTLRSARMEFFDLSGRKISETSWDVLNGRQSCQVATASHLPAGTYLARLTSNGQLIKNQLMIVSIQ
ncbi:MAG TPA: hypothetical protein VG890_02385 [Puia sp.]|nr:hypothetical protein [Puia sp.]